ncbi:MAG: AsmA-like C-terminal region-containing protein [Thermoanaerobaculales bacterium]|jgi:uncharacterized protein involved in outer membrane biogenesis|nr:AsmA-like C-terminal region-containing protein [Thermoanaerobaculales bacterium]
MSRRRKIVVAAVSVLVLLPASLVLYLSLSDLAAWRDTVASIATKALERELGIHGDFEVDLGSVTRVRATELTLANTPWGSEAEMATIDRIEAEIELWPLISGVVHLGSVEIEGGRALFEFDGENGSNWALGKRGGEGLGNPVRLRIDSIRARDVDLVFRSSSAESDWEVAVAQLASTGSPAGAHQLSASGQLRGEDFVLDGRLATLESLVNLGSVNHDLTIQLGSNRLTSAGIIADPASLSGLDLRTELSAPDPTELFGLFGLFGLPVTPMEPFTATLTASPESGQTAFDVAVDWPAADLGAAGTIDSILTPRDVDLEFRFDGPDIRPIAELFQAGEFPELAFSARGQLRWKGFPVEVSDLHVTVGDNRITADGRLGAPPRMLGTDFRFEGAGPDVAALAVLAGRQLPRNAFEITGHLLRVETGFRIDDASVSIGATTASAAGFVGDPPGYEDTDLELEVEGSDLARYSDLVGLSLPNQPFRIAGRLTPGDGAINLHGVEAELGDGRITIDGQLTTEPGMTGTDLTFEAVGIDSLHISEMLGHDDVPSSEISAEGRVTVTPDGYRLHGIDAEFMGITVAADGLITRSKQMAGSRLQVRANGADASIFDPFVAPRSLPVEYFSVNGTFELDRDSVRLLEVDVGLAGASAILDGVVSIGDADGLELTVDARGPSLAVLDTLVPEIELPSSPFSASGSASLRDGALGLDRTVAQLADSRLEIDGVVALDRQWIGSNARVSLSGGDLGEFGRLLAHGFEWQLPGLPAQEFAAVGEVAVDPRGIQLSGLELALGASTATVNGVVAATPDLSGSDLELRADGRDFAPIGAIFGLELPNEPFSLDGTVSKDGSLVRFKGLSVRFGELRADLEGTLGSLPMLVGTDLSLSAAGPDLSVLREFTGVGALPPRPFEVSARFSGDPSRFTGNALDLRIGSTDVSGSVTVDVVSKPTFSARLTSRRIEIADLLERADPEDATDDAPNLTPADRVFSVEPLDLPMLGRVDGSLEWTVDELRFPLHTYRDISLAGDLEDSRFEVTSFRGTGSRGGVLQGSGSLSPAADGYRIEGRVTLDNAMINLGARNADPSQYTQVDASLSLDLAGGSLYELMAGADGRFVLSATGGVVRKSLVDLASADVLVTLLKALNPFAKTEATELGCAVLAASFDDGVMTLEPAAIQTNAVTILGDGTVDFATEKLKLDWVSKPRKGLGLSASAITNSYIRLGGTLADPDVQVKPLEAAATTGVAVATMGISLVARGLWDRVTAEKKVCRRALKRVEAMEQPGGGE